MLFGLVYALRALLWTSMQYAFVKNINLNFFPHECVLFQIVHIYSFVSRPNHELY